MAPPVMRRGAGTGANSTITNAAAIVDGHVIPMEDVALKCPA